MIGRLGWSPAAVLAVGAILATAGVKAQRALPLRAPLGEAVPTEIEGFHGRDVALSDAEARVAAVTSYLARTYEGGDSAGRATFSLYVGYYDRQTGGKTIHSPKNCLPGAGWEALTSRTAPIATPSGPVVVNRYLIQRGASQALVLYWYQGRGRVEANEYRVKWNLLRDAALKRRSDEALVRVVVPITGTEEQAFTLASRVAATVVLRLVQALPS